MAAPDPLALLLALLLLQYLEHPGRLRVVDDDEVVVFVQRVGVVFVHLEEQVAHLVRPGHLRALQPVVHRLRDGEEGFVPFEQPPLDLHPEVAHQRDLGIQELRDAAAECRARNVEDARALETLRSFAELGDHLRADDGGIVAQGFGRRRYEVQHGAGPEDMRLMLPATGR